MKRTTLYLCLLLGLGTGLLPWALAARQNVPGAPTSGNKTTPDPSMRVAADCDPASSSSTLDINNVRALLHNGGDMWWDLVGNPRYEVPKVDNPADAKHSMFAGSLWIGGIDGSGQLRLAAQTYRQSGNDFWPGPLRNAPGSEGTVDKAICDKWNRHFKIEKVDIDRFLSDLAAGEACGTLQQRFPVIFNWPAINNDPGFERFLAPFIDADGDQDYNPCAGDYPDILGDQAIFWVINDRGNIHTETNAAPIGIEIQMLAFGFATANVVNDMTFYRQRVINRSTLTLRDTYIGQWADPDLGFAFDDYVGCDTNRGLGFCYNGDPIDNLPQGYGANPPAIGVDFFQGPIADLNDGVDNDRDGQIDEFEVDCATGELVPERISMAKFVYYENDFSVRGNPTNAQHFYGYLTGFWKNGSPVVDDRSPTLGNGNGFPDPGESSARPTDFMFPDYPSTGCLGVNVTRSSGTPFVETITPFDRRFIQSAGPFTLRPGAVNEIITGVVWARDISGALDPLPNVASVCLMLQADDIAQALFDACFELLNGPDAPDLAINEYDRELLLSWDYARIGPASNNFYENYAEVDPVLAQQPGVDAEFNFEGYMVYQLIDGSVSATDLDNPQRARLIAQCDIKNDVSVIVNREQRLIPGLREPVIVDRIMVDGANEGLFHSLRVTEDAFVEGTDKRLVNYRTYYYTIIAYAYNDTSSDGRKFVVGNGNFRRYAAVPHITSFQNFGTVLNSQYGVGPNITRVTGAGNGGVALQLAPETIQEILSFGNVASPTYLGGAGPVRIKVVDPKTVRAANYEVRITRDRFLRQDTLQLGGGAADTLKYFVDWELYVQENGGPFNLLYQNVYTARHYYDTAQPPRFLPEPLSGAERLIRDHGISIAVKDNLSPGFPEEDLRNGFLSSSIRFSDNNRAWYQSFPDVNEPSNLLNWIRSGTEGAREAASVAQRDWYDSTYVNNRAYDPNQVYENTPGGLAPYIMTAHFNTELDIIGPRINAYIEGPFLPNHQARVGELKTLKDLFNVDIVLTPDRNLWSRCIVVETSPNQNLSLDINGNPGGASPMTARHANGRDINGNPQLGAQNQGMSYFPGYAINVDKGQRVNIFFGESSFHQANNGNDLLFNPTNILTDASGLGNNRIVGGRHYIYVTDLPYDGCETIRQHLQVGNTLPVEPVQPLANSPITFLRNGDTVNIANAYRHVVWTAIPLATNPSLVFRDPAQMPTEVRISMRVNRQYERFCETCDNPTFRFSTDALAAQLNETNVAKASLNEIRMVPNPYYGGSGVGRGRYELSQLDTRAKITNLPFKCTIRIFTLNGNLVRIYRKESDEPDIEWDLKNDFGVPIASGVYIIHVDAGDLGEKILKFMCIMPQIDLNAY